MKKLKIIYVYDAHCSWCFAFSTVMQEIKKKYNSEFDFEVISGGMVVGEQIGELSKRYPPEKLLEAYARINEMTGTVFSEEYLAKVKTGKTYINSEIPAVALSILKEHNEDKAIDFAHALQEQFFTEAKAVNDDAVYSHLAKEYGMDSEDFFKKMKDKKYLEAARYDFALSRQLQVTGYPQVLVQTDDTQFYLIAKGYTPFEALDERLQSVKKSLNVA
ncbi:MAG: DsbA family protein [Saprospiraceae bacterium]